MQLNKRIERWMRLRKKLRAQIVQTKSSARLQTLVKRLHAVNRDQRKCIGAVGNDAKLEHVAVSLSDVVARIKIKSISGW